MPQGTATGIQPFRGLVVRPEVAHDVVSPAYDAMTGPQRRAFRTDHPDSFLHVTRSAEDEPDGDDIDNATLVARGRRALDRLIERDVFASHGEPAYYVYRLAIGDHEQHGLVCEVPSAYYHSVAKPHEAVRPARAALLAEHFQVVRAASSPIACATRDDEALLQNVLIEACEGDPILDLRTDDGLRQTVWRCDSQAFGDRVESCLADAPLFIVDGHHRSAANQQLADQGTDVPVLATIFPDRSLNLVGFHRLLAVSQPEVISDILYEIGRRFATTVVPPVDHLDAGHVALVIDGRWHLVTFDERPVAGSAQILLGSVDPVVLEREILRGIVAPITDFSISYIPDLGTFGAIVELAEADKLVPVLVPPVTMAEMMAVAEGGVIMPAKSTYFTPKVRSGLFLLPFD